jgi:hypothetical protein
MFGGNRSGKTTCGGMEFLFHLTNLYPKWYPQANKLPLPIKGRIIAKDFQKGVGEVIIPFFEEWLDMSIVAKKIRNPIGIPVKWILKNGSVFDILTHEQDVEQFEGWKGNILWCDEPPPRNRYIASLRGLVDFRGKNWLTLTPLTQPWIYDEIYCRSNGTNITAVVTDITDNPHISKEAIEEFTSKLTEEEKEARLHGRFLHLSGLVYKEFNPDIHIMEPPKIQESWTRYFAIDPHDRKATACLWMAVDPQDNHYIYDELHLGGMDIEQIAHAIHAQEGDLKPHVRLIDPHMDKENELVGGFNVRKELMKHGVYCQRASSDPVLGKSRVRGALQPRYSNLQKTEKPQLRVSRQCTKTIYEFQHYIWAEYKDKDYGQKDAVRKKDDDFMDCLRYIYNYGPRFIEAEQDDEELRFEGTFTKHPVSVSSSKRTGYHDLIEGK